MGSTRSACSGSPKESSLWKSCPPRQRLGRNICGVGWHASSLPPFLLRWVKSISISIMVLKPATNPVQCNGLDFSRSSSKPLTNLTSCIGGNFLTGASWYRSEQGRDFGPNLHPFRDSQPGFRFQVSGDSRTIQCCDINYPIFLSVLLVALFTIFLRLSELFQTVTNLVH